MLIVSMADVVTTGPLIAFASVLAGSLGVPIPTLAAIIFVGSLMAERHADAAVVVLVFGVAMLGAVLGDTTWFFAGRRFGSAILGLICRLSLSRDTCVRRTADIFGRRGIKVLLFARFIPGLSVVTAPLAGISGTSLPRFLTFAETGAALWIASGLALGYFFTDQVGALLQALEHFGLDLGGTAVALVAIYVGVSWTRRQFLIRKLRMARVTADQLAAMLRTGETTAIIDARAEIEIDADPFTLPGAIILGPAENDQALRRLPRLQSVAIYCSCPNEITAAMVAKRMHRLGFMDVRPLLGGIDAWRTAGYPVAPAIEATPLAGPAQGTVVSNLMSVPSA